jgi:phage FluMu protein Com
MAHRVIVNTGIKSDNFFIDEVKNMIHKVAPLYGINKNDLDFLENPSINLEDVMTLLDIDDRLFFPFTNPEIQLNESRELRAVKELLVRTLDYALMGPPCKKHNKLAQKMNSGDIILSFNYDILMDNALFSLGKITDSGYKMNFSNVSQDGQWRRPDDISSKVTLFKLHGSLNWIRCGFCGTLLLYRFQKQTLVGAQEFQCPRCSSGEAFAKRMIIPPTQSKEYGDRDITFLWVQADNLLKDISRIICIGYSFPSSDFDVISLIRRFRARQKDIPEGYFISPDQTAKKRLEKLLGKEMKNFRYLSDYLEVT